VRIVIFQILLILTFASLFACKKSTKKLITEQEKQDQYILYQTSNNPLTNFMNPWSEERPQKTTFTAHHDMDSIFFEWKVLDDNLLIYEHIDTELAVLRSDRVEIFMAADTSLTKYFSFEIDLTGRVFDSRGSFGKSSNAKWNCPYKYKLQTAKNGNEFVVKMNWSQKDLEKLKVLKDDEIIAGVFRADYNPILPDKKPNWITWIDPKTKRPNFHTPSAFGTLILSE